MWLDRLIYCPFIILAVIRPAHNGKSPSLCIQQLIVWGSSAGLSLPKSYSKNNATLGTLHFGIQLLKFIAYSCSLLLLHISASLLYIEVLNPVCCNSPTFTGSRMLHAARCHAVSKQVHSSIQQICRFNAEVMQSCPSRFQATWIDDVKWNHYRDDSGLFHVNRTGRDLAKTFVALTWISFEPTTVLSMLREQKFCGGICCIALMLGNETVYWILTRFSRRQLDF